MVSNNNNGNNSVRIIKNSSNSNEITKPTNTEMPIRNKGGRKNKPPGELKKHRRTVYTSFEKEDPIIENFLRGREFSVVMREILFEAIEGEQ